MSKFDKIQKKWQNKWAKAGIFKAKTGSKKPKFYVLEMYPYPSGVAAHVGHSRNYVMGDCLSRYKRMRGFNVLYPMGWDSFGLPTENEAIAKGIHPTKSIKKSIDVMKDQFNALSLSYDWSKELATHEPEYYKWDQWLFLQLYKNGLAYQKLAPGNWCPKCKTTLANEDVKSGKCWRCDSEVVQKEINQWFIKITKYIDPLLKGLDKIKWSERLKTLQRNWIGKSHGIDLIFKIKDLDLQLDTFTTRPDTYYGITFMVLAPEHPLVPKLVKGTPFETEVNKFIEDTKKFSELERLSFTKEKKGVFTGRCIINPITKEEIPLWLANYVVMGYGTGAVIGVPTQDQRDFEFAEEYGLRFKNVINPPGKELKEYDMREAYTKEGVLTNSGKFNGMNNKEAIEAISDFLVKKKAGKRTINYRIRDWCISRQRYWGAPIPIIHCEKCGAVPVPEKDLPVKLPLKVNFSKKGATPLATNKSFVNVKCPKCKGRGKRETDTMTTFVDSAWYFLRFTNPKYSKSMFDPKAIKYWMPVNQYIGGIEHAVGHLLYSRFVVKFLHKLKLLNFDEPFLNLLNQGMIQKGGVKMSKSKGNTIDPRDVIKKYDVDTLRTYLLFMALPDKDVEWSDRDLASTNKFLEKVRNFHKLKEDKKHLDYINSVSQGKIKSITNALENLQYNVALIDLMDFANKIQKYPSKYAIKIFLQLLTPFAPHTAEEIWSKVGNKGLVSTSGWPKVDKKKINKKAEELITSIQKSSEDIHHILKIVGKKPKEIYLYVLPNELKMYKEVEKPFSKEFKAKVKVYAVNDKNKYDPEKKASKAKPGKPGIYIK